MNNSTYNSDLKAQKLKQKLDLINEKYGNNVNFELSSITSNGFHHHFDDHENQNEIENVVQEENNDIEKKENIITENEKKKKNLEWFNKQNKLGNNNVPLKRYQPIKQFSSEPLKFKVIFEDPNRGYIDYKTPIQPDLRTRSAFTSMNQIDKFQYFTPGMYEALTPIRGSKGLLLNSREGRSYKRGAPLHITNIDRIEGGQFRGQLKNGEWVTIKEQTGKPLVRQVVEQDDNSYSREEFLSFVKPTIVRTKSGSTGYAIPYDEEFDHTSTETDFINPEQIFQYPNFDHDLPSTDAKSSLASKQSTLSSLSRANTPANFFYTRF